MSILPVCVVIEMASGFASDRKPPVSDPMLMLALKRSSFPSIRVAPFADRVPGPDTFTDNPFAGLKSMNPVLVPSLETICEAEVPNVTCRVPEGDWKNVRAAVTPVSSMLPLFTMIGAANAKTGPVMLI